jgi:hypothetical protein
MCVVLRYVGHAVHSTVGRASSSARSSARGRIYWKKSLPGLYNGTAAQSVSEARLQPRVMVEIEDPSRQLDSELQNAAAYMRIV